MKSLYKLYVLCEDYKEKRISAFERFKTKNGSYVHRFFNFDRIVDSDPTSTEKILGKYSDWLLKLYNLNKLDIENLSSVKYDLELFDKNVINLPIKDINQLKSIEELSNLVKDLQGKQIRGNVKEIIGNENDIEFILETDKWLVLEPKTVEANRKWAGYGVEENKRPRWCTTIDQFSNYNKGGKFPIYLIINKKNVEEKYQVVTNEFSIWDRSNKPVAYKVGGETMEESYEWLKKNGLEKLAITISEKFEEENLKELRVGYPNKTNEELKELSRKGYSYEVDSNGNKYWYLNGNRHREDGPAVEWANGSKCWYINGKKHREDGPAIEYKNGSKSWYLSGKCHREDGPAYIGADGDKVWYLNGKLHREDGPAVEWADGDKVWYINGRNYGNKEPDNWIELVSKNKQVKKEYKLKPLSKMV